MFEVREHGAGRALELMYLFGFELTQSKQGSCSESSSGKGHRRRKTVKGSVCECHLNGLRKLG